MSNKPDAHVEAMILPLFEMHLALERQFVAFALDHLKLSRDDLAECVAYMDRMCPEVESMYRLMTHTQLVEKLRLLRPGLLEH